MTASEETSDAGDPRPFGLALTVEELSTLPYLMGGQCPVSERIGIATIEDRDDPIFDIGFRSLLVRGLVRVEGEDVELFEELRSLGELLADAEEAWVVAVETAAAIETLALVRAQNRAICLLPGPIGVYSYRVVSADLPAEIAALVHLLPTHELTPLRPDVAATVVVQRVLPEHPAFFVEVDAAGRIRVVGTQGADTHDTAALARILALA